MSSPNPVASGGTSDALYVQEPGDALPVSINDIAQGQFGDCFFLAALGEIAFRDPAYISQALISPQADGTEDVRLFMTSGGVHMESYDDTLAQSFVPVSFNVNNDFSPDAVNNDNASDVVNGVKEIWPQVVEQAYSDYTSGAFANGGYDTAAIEALTGHRAYYQPTETMTFRELNHLNNAGALMTFDTPGSGDLGYNLLDDHAYMFVGLENMNGKTYVELANPWGNTQPDPIPFSQVASVLPQFNHGAI